MAVDNPAKHLTNILSKKSNKTKTTGFAKFIETCVTEQLNQRVENNASMLADKEKFTDEELKKMKGKDFQLDKLNCSNKRDEKNVYYLDINGIKFSSRSSVTGAELRGVKLEKALKNLKATDPKITLYDALGKLIKEDPLTQVSAFFSMLTIHDYKPSNSKDNIIEALVKLSKACMDYANKGTDKDLLSKEESTKHLNKILEIQGENIISEALDDTQSKDNLLSTIKNKIIENLKNKLPAKLSKKSTPSLLYPKTIKEINKQLKQLRIESKPEKHYEIASKIKKLTESTKKWPKEINELKKQIDPLIANYRLKFGYEIDLTENNQPKQIIAHI